MSREALMARNHAVVSVTSPAGAARVPCIPLNHAARALTVVGVVASSGSLVDGLVEPRGEGLSARVVYPTGAVQRIFGGFEIGFPRDVCECGHLLQGHSFDGLVCEVVWGCACEGFVDVDRDGA